MTEENHLSTETEKDSINRSSTEELRSTNDLNLDKEPSNYKPIQYEKEIGKWNTCGFLFDRQCLTFAITAIFSFTLIIFCITQLSSPELPNDKFTLYVTLLTGVINSWLPSPLFK